MADDLGARLVQAGLVTADQLDDALGAAPPHEGALVRALVRCGVSEDALAGFFVAAGFGPLVDAAALERAEARAALSPRMACELSALPIRRSPEGLMVAMAAPTDRHALGELRRAMGEDVRPMVARVSELARVLARLYPNAAPEPPPRYDSEPPVLELLRRRREDDVRLLERLVGPAEPVLPLVRQKSRTAPRYPARSKVITRSFERTEADGERSIIPPEHARWDLDSSDPPRAGLPRPTRGEAPPPVGATLAALRASRARDEVVALACRGALTVCRAALLLALRQGVLKGWDGAGPGLTHEAVRNLWIPTHSPSMFRDVIARGEPYEGPHQSSAADGLFRAAVGSRGGQAAIHPVRVGGKVVAVLAADEVAYGAAGRARIEILARAAGEALERLIVESKRR